MGPENPQERPASGRLPFGMLAVFTVIAALTIWRAFIPPIVGIADQGDFIRVLGPLGYAPTPRGPEHGFAYVTRTYQWDPSYRQAAWEEPSSALLPMFAAVGINRLRGRAASFDITAIGAAHVALFLLAVYRLFHATRQLNGRWVIWILSALALTDVGYAAYWNSLYTEPAACIWFLFLLGESVAMCATGHANLTAILRWSAFGALWIAAKSQNAPFCIPLAVTALALALLTTRRAAKAAFLAAAFAMLFTGASVYMLRKPAPRLATLYNSIFHGILSYSPDPAADLRALGLSPAYVKYSGTLPWSPNSGAGEGEVIRALSGRFMPIRVVGFYLARPTRLMGRVNRVLQGALSFRFSYCGNYPQSAGKPPGAKSTALSLWSLFHEKALGSVALAIPWTLLAAGAAGVALLLGWRKRLPPAAQRWLALAVCLTVCCLVAFLTATFGDAWEDVKHQFQFNMLLDACLIFLAAACVTAAKRRLSDTQVRTVNCQGARP